MNVQWALQTILESDALDFVNGQLQLDYLNEDTIGGRDVDGYDGMSLYQDEGRILYALIRILRPEIVVEVGVDAGASSAHILSALHRNGQGHLHSYDIKDEWVGWRVPDDLRYRWTLHTGEDALTAEMPPRADFVFEDGNHQYEWTRDMLIRLKGLRPRIILSHDFYTHLTYGGFEVERAFMEVLPNGKGIQLNGTITGLGYAWLKS